MKTITGSVVRVTVRKSGGWGIAIIKENVTGNKVTVVGRGVADLTQGDCAEFDGDDQMHDRFGNQFAVSELRLMDTVGHPGLENAMLMFKGIGRAHAGRLVKDYDEDPKKFVKSFQDMVTDVVGRWVAGGIGTILPGTIRLGPKGLAACLEYVIARNAVRSTTEDPRNSERKVSRITAFTRTIDAALIDLREKFSVDPYQVLCKKYGFREADAILVKKAIISKHAGVRVRYAMEDLLTGRNDVLFPFYAIVQQAAAEFDIDIDPIDMEGTEDPFEMPDNVITKRLTNEHYLGERALIRAEEATLVGFSRLMKSPRLDLTNIPDEILHKGLTVKLTAEQREVILNNVKDPVGLISGGAGCGKTTIAKAVINVLEHKGIQVLLAAPTNKAARRLAQQTDRPASSIHALLEPFPDQSELGDPFGTGFYFSMNQANPFRQTAILLDEASMIDTRLFAACMWAIGQGCRLILVGDHKQLPPIREGCPFVDMLHHIPSTHLTKILRSNPGRMQLNQQAIRYGKLQDINYEPSEDWTFVEKLNDEETKKAVIDVARQLYKQHGPYGFQIISPRRIGHPLSTYELNKAFRAEVLNVADATFRAGDKGICHKAITSASLINGDMFLVDEINPSSKSMSIIKEFQKDKDDREILPLFDEHVDFGWAITVHKYQGCEAPFIIYVASDSFGKFVTRNMVYTAVTRAQKKVIVIGQKQAFQDSLTREETSRLTLLNLTLKEAYVASRSPATNNGRPAAVGHSSEAEEE